MTFYNDWPYCLDVHHLHLNKKQYFNDMMINDNDDLKLEDSPLITRGIHIDKIIDEVFQE